MPSSEECPCPKKSCERHGNCAPCRLHHAKKGKHPYCGKFASLR